MASDPYKYFRVEARELVESLSRDVLELERGAVARERIAGLLRAAHTLKGAARVVKHREIADLAHALEDALAPLRSGDTAPSPTELESLVGILRALEGRVETLTRRPASDRTATATAGGDELVRTLRADVEEIDRLRHGLDESQAQLSGLMRELRSVEQIQRLADLMVHQLRSRGSERAGGGRTIAEELRDHVRRLDRDIGIRAEAIRRELASARDTAEALRLVPASAIFGVLERTARDAASALGKRVTFESIGGDLRFEGHLLASVQGALVQFVRNAVAHGIESEAERRASGKSPQGMVTVKVQRVGGSVCFTCHDDGRGIDTDAVRRVSRERGIPSAGDPSEEAILELLLRGGISTASSVTEVSGRGVGLDVAREAASRLGGKISLRSEPGRGTSVELTVPTSLSSFDALIVHLGGREVAIPADAVRMTARISSGDIARTEEGDAISFEGKLVPFKSMSARLRDNPQERKPGPRLVVFVRSRETEVALAVERVLGVRRIALHPLPPLTPADPVLSGAWLGPDGSPRIALDPEKLVSLRSERDSSDAPAPRRRAPILIIDDSLTTRMLERSILEAAGYEVELATSAEEALEKAREQRYSLFLVDVEMPGMDGFSFVAHTRADPTLRETPAILVTSRNAPGDRERGRSAGAQAYIVKSEFNQTDLLDRIRTLVG